MITYTPDSTIAAALTALQGQTLNHTTAAAIGASLRQIKNNMANDLFGIRNGLVNDLSQGAFGIKKALIAVQNGLTLAQISAGAGANQQWGEFEFLNDLDPSDPFAASIITAFTPLQTLAAAVAAVS